GLSQPQKLNILKIICLMTVGPSPVDRISAVSGARRKRFRLDEVASQEGHGHLIKVQNQHSNLSAYNQADS
uniref:hypothetical protein n=1 Tax=Pseudomonas sp. VB3 TaxID=2994641 RepID=UPI0022EC8EEC